MGAKCCALRNRHRIPQGLIVKITMIRSSLVLLLFLPVLYFATAGRPSAQVTDEQAPATFSARFETSQGPFVIEVQREWAPRAADRFYTLVKRGAPASSTGPKERVKPSSSTRSTDRAWQWAVR